MAERSKRILAVCAIGAVGAAGAVGSHAEAGQPTESLRPGGAQLELSTAGGPLHAIAGNLDENDEEAIERRGRAEATGGREARGRELRGEDDD